MRGLVLLLAISALGCGPFANGQNELLVFSRTGPFVLGETYTLDVGFPGPLFWQGRMCTAVATPPPTGATLVSTAPEIAEIVSVSGNTCGGVSGTLRPLRTGHGQVSASVLDLLGTTPATMDTLDFWVEEADHVILTGDTQQLGTPLEPDEIRIPREPELVPLLDVLVRSASDTTLDYTTEPTFSSEPPGIVELSGGVGVLVVRPLSAGTTRVTATVLGLSDTVTIVVDP